MNILFITRAFGRTKGGMERLSYEMVQALSKQPGLETDVVAYQGDQKFSPLFNLTALPKALRQARRADVIHIGDPVLSLLGWILKIIVRKPIAVHVHGLDILYANSLYQLYLDLFFKNFNAYFAISRHVKGVLTTRFPTTSSRSHILTPGVTDRFYNPTVEKKKLAKLLKRDLKNKRVLLTTGRLVKRKGHEWFIREVLPHLPSNYIYVIAGDGPEFGNLLPLTKGVVFLGRVNESKLRVLYNTVDAFVQPNVPVYGDVEGFGLVLLEAALCNRPVFASDLEGIKDAIHPGRNGTLLPAQNPRAWINALQNIVPVPDSRQYTLQRFSWQARIPDYVHALQTIIR